MSYLDVSPMMTALRTTPEEFEVQSGWLRHIPSQHHFAFDRDGGVQIRAQCNCAMLAIKSDQEKELHGAFQQWQASYWQPLMINREFASHFKPRSALRQMLINVTAWMHRRLSQRGEARHRHHAGAMIPAE